MRISAPDVTSNRSSEHPSSSRPNFLGRLKLGVLEGLSKRSLVLALVGGLLAGPACGDDGVSTGGTVSSGESVTDTSVGVTSSSTGEVPTTTGDETGGSTVTSGTSGGTTMGGTESGTMTEGMVCPDGGGVEECRPTGFIDIDCGDEGEPPCIANENGISVYGCSVLGENFFSATLVPTPGNDDYREVNSMIIDDLMMEGIGNFSCTFKPLESGFHLIKFAIEGEGGSIEIQKEVGAF